MRVLPRFLSLVVVLTGLTGTAAVLSGGVPAIGATPPSAARTGDPAQTMWRSRGPLSTRAFPGPNPRTGERPVISGRVEAIVAQENTCFGGTCRVLYVGAAGGGVWKTSNGGQTWKPLTDAQGSLSTNALALNQAHPQQIYAGTGEHQFFDASRGVGILHSSNGGATWETLGGSVTVNRAVTGLIIDPRTVNSPHPTLYATTSTTFSPGSATYRNSPLPPGTSPAGFLRSIDGGHTWALSNPTGVNASEAGADSLAIDPHHPNTLYAGFIQRLLGRYSGTPRFGVYKSVDDGRHWKLLSGGVLPTANPAAHVIIDRIALAVAPSDGRVVYAAFSVGPPTGETLMLYRSSDRGGRWTHLTGTPNVCGRIIGAGGQPDESSQCFFDMPLAIGPASPDVVYLGGIGNIGYLDPKSNPGSPCAHLTHLPLACQATLVKTTDGGQTWTDIGSNPSGAPLHGDNHVVYIPATDPRAVYDGDDGGLWHSRNGGTTWRDQNRGLNTMLFQTVAVGASGALYGGTQDNGEWRSLGSTTWMANPLRADTGAIVTDPTDANRLYWMGNGDLTRDDHALSTANPYPPQTDVAPFQNEGALIYNPAVLAPTRPSMILAGTDRLWRSMNRGGVDGNRDGSAFNDRSDTDDWVSITPHYNTAGANAFVNPGPFISAIAVSPVDAKVVAFGLGNGSIYLSTNATHAVTTNHSCDPRINQQNAITCTVTSGVVWKKVSAGLPGRFVASIRFLPRSSRALIAVFSNYAANTPGQPGHLFLSRDRGSHWRRVDAGLPDLPYSDVAISPLTGALYASGDYHIFVSRDDGRRWAPMDGNRAHAPVYQMAYDTRKGRNGRVTGHLLAATHGRGIWEAPAP